MPCAHKDHGFPLGRLVEVPLEDTSNVLLQRGRVGHVRARRFLHRFDHAEAPLLEDVRGRLLVDEPAIDEVRPPDELARL